MSSSFYTNVEKRGNRILLRYVENGERKAQEVSFKPYIYVSATKAPDAISLHGEALNKISFDDIKSFDEYIQRFKDVDGYKMFGMRDIPFQFISQQYPGKIKYDMSLIHGAIFDIEVYSGDVDENGEPVSGPFPDPVEALYPITAITIYHTVKKQYFVFGLHKFKQRTLAKFAYDHKDEDIGGLDVVYIGFDTEKELLNALTLWWNDQQFDFMTGWNTEGFDIPYMVNRTRMIAGDNAVKRYSPWGIVKSRNYDTGYGQALTYDFMGIAHLDYMQVFQKHAFHQPVDWKLETVASEILGEGKLSYDEAGSLNTLYITNYPKYIRYNIKDVALIVKMDAKLNLIALMYTLAFFTKSNVQDGLGTVKPWSSALYGMLHERGIEPELKSVYEGDVRFAGGFVRIPTPGKYRWVVSVDLNSLYPHLMQQYNLGPETIVEPYDLPVDVMAIPNFTLDDLLHKRIDLSALKKHDLLMTANRQFFKRNKMSILSEKTREMYTERKGIKSNMLKLMQEKDNLLGVTNPDQQHIADAYVLEQSIAAMDVLQNSIKVCMNSLFGAVGNRWFREYFDIRVAEGITMSGQLSILWITKKLDEYFNKLLNLGEINHRITRTETETFLNVTGGSVFAFYQDTDSVYLSLDKLVDKLFTKEQQENDKERIVNFLDAMFKDKIEPYIDTCYQELAEYMNAYEQRMFMKRESIASDAVWTAKKRYSLLVLDNEGVRFANPKMKFLGLEARKSSTPMHCRGWLEECYRIGLDGNQDLLQTKVKLIRQEFNSKPVEEIAAPRTVNNLEKYSEQGSIWIKGTPKHVRAALIHNHLIEKLKLKNVKPVMSGDKILFANLKTGNPYGYDVIGFQSYLPKEFGLDKWIDYQSTFEKTFLEPLDLYVGAIGWNSTPQASVMSFFS